MSWYLTITSEMREAGLNGNGLLVYAIVFGYSQEQDGCCYLSLASIAERAGCTQETARNILKNLAADGFIERFEFMDNGIHRVAYRTTQKIWGTQNFRVDPPKNSCDPPKNFGAYNKSDIKDENKGDVYNAHARFVRPSFEDVEAYCRSRSNGIDPQAFIDYYTANGWKVGGNPMKDWRAAVRNWEQRRKQNPAPQVPRPSQHISPEERTLAALARLQERDGMLHTFNTPEDQ